MKTQRVVVVTGASSGVGRACARAFARRDAQLALLARGVDGLEAAAAEARADGAVALPIPTDVADYTQVEAAAVRIEHELGGIDVWVNNAMLSVFSPVKELAPDEVRRVTEVTYFGYVHGTLAALRRMLPRNEGVIVQVGSALAYRAIPLQAAYCAAKHAIEGFTESLRCELRHDGSNVRVTMVQLPALNTPHFSVVRSRLPRHPKPVPPIFEPELAAEAVVWAAEHPRRELIVGFSTFRALVANKVAPGLVDRYLARSGYDSQQSDTPVDRDRPDNLWDPVRGDRGAHGIFGDEARTRSVQLWVTEHRRALAATGVAALSALERAPERPALSGVAARRYGERAIRCVTWAATSLICCSTACPWTFRAVTGRRRPAPFGTPRLRSRSAGADRAVAR
jgi:NAD(P)-dependent dehydrogenase (short-subunit alcohol dehydrogenase family)